MTLKEYGLRIEAFRYAEVDRDFWHHWQAYLSFIASGMKTQGKKQVPVYRTFKKFFDYEEELEKRTKTRSTPSRFEGIGKVIKKYE